LGGRQYNSEFAHLKDLLSRTSQEHALLIIRAFMRQHNIRNNKATGKHPHTTAALLDR
jgi:hypothetical protein